MKKPPKGISMTNTTSEIANALGGDFSGFDYYADDYQGERSPEIYDNLAEANEAFRETMQELGLEALPLENYINAITE